MHRILLLLIATLAYGCATEPENVEPAPCGNFKPVAFSYSPVWDGRDAAVAAVQQDFLERFDYDSDFSVRDIDGAELESLVQEQSRSELAPVLEPLIGDPDARFVIIEALAAHDYMPPAVVLVVPPNSGREDILRAAFPDPASFYIGVLPFDDALETDAEPGTELAKQKLRALVVAPTLAGLDLSGTTFANVDMAGKSFAGANLRGATFRNANLEGADLTGADLTDANIAQARVPGVTWTDATCPDGRNANDRGGHCLPELEYGDIEALKERFTLGHSRFTRVMYGYEGPIEPRMINGQQLYELEKKHGDVDVFAEFHLILHHPNVQILMLELEQHARAPKGVLFFFSPKSGLTPSAKKRFDEGFTADLGRSEPWSYAHPHAPDRPDINFEVALQNGRDAVTKMAPDQIRKKMEQGDEFAVIISADGCGNIPKLLAGIGAIPNLDDYSGKIIDLAAGGGKESDGHKLAAELVDRIAYPTMVFIRDGQVVARTLGAQDYPTIHNRLAHHFGKPHLDWVRRKTISSDEDRRRAELRAVAGSSGFDDENWDGQDLSGAYLRHHTLTNTSFRGANLAGADLRSASLAYADFTDAELTGAKVDGALWYRTVCPDGKTSEDHGGACPIPAEAQ